MIRTGWLIPYAAVLALTSAVPTPLAAAEIKTSPELAAKFVQDLGNQAVTLLAKYPDSETLELQTQLRDLVRASFDFNAISRFVLGQTWQKATPAQQQEYQALFAAWTTDSYASRLGADKGGSLTVIDAQPGLNTADALVRTQINRADGTTIPATLRVHNSKGGMRIIDVTMEGVSIDVTQRDDFAAVVQRKGLNGLISDLKAHVNNRGVEAAR